MKNKLKIKIPDHIQTFFCKKRNTIIFLNGNYKKAIRPKLRVLLHKTREMSYLYVTSIFIEKISGVEIGNLKKTQGLIVAEIKHIIIESEVRLYKRLKFVGVGYRALLEDGCISDNFTLKLGFSHLVHFKLNKEIQGFYLKRGPKLTVFGKCSLKDLTQTSSSIRRCKHPEPYKGKGILFLDEKIDLKIGKRV